jgi:hypothetical protein
MEVGADVALRQRAALRGIGGPVKFLLANPPIPKI